MYWKEDKNQMVRAYELLYDIEMTLVHHIIDTFRENYGYHWYKHLTTNIDFERANYRQLISYLKVYKNIFPHVNAQNFQKIYDLYPVRSKICRMKPLTSRELLYLKECHQLVNELFSKEEVL